MFEIYDIYLLLLPRFPSYPFQTIAVLSNRRPLGDIIFVISNEMR